MTLGGERKAVQNPLIRYAADVGWTYVGPEEALRLRRGRGGAVFHDVLVAQLRRLNPGIVDALAAEQIISRLLRVRPHIEGNLEVWEYLNGLKTVFVGEERRERTVRLLDLDYGLVIIIALGPLDCQPQLSARADVAQPCYLLLV